MRKRMISVIGLEGIPRIGARDDLANMIVEVAARISVPIEDGDVLVVAQKVVSKAEGRIVQLKDVRSSRKAKEVAKITRKDPRFVELVLRETKRVVKASKEALIVETKQGIICLNAGIDKSNVFGYESYALLPENPDESAKRIRSKIQKLTGKNVAVIISDTYSRPFRRGQVEFAIGISGISPFRDYRGQEDLFGYMLKVKNVALVDEIASAAELIMGQAKEAVPVVIFKNVRRDRGSEAVSIEDLAITREEDLFKKCL